MPIDIDALSRIVEEATTAGSNPVPRIVVSVATRDNGVVFEKASGIKRYADPPSESNRVAMDSMFWFASQTKLITSLAAALCIEKGLFTLDSLAEDFVPELKTIKVLEGFDDNGNEILREPKSRITIRNLCTHTAGTVFTTSSPLLDRYREKHNLETVWRGPSGPRSTTASLPLMYDPGERFSYAHDNDLLLFAVEGASGMDMEEFCQKHIFGPLDIHDMVWRREEEHLAKEVDLCMTKADGTGYTGLPLGVVHKPLACSGGGGLFGTAPSYMKVLRALLNEGVYPDNGKRVVKKETIDMMSTPLVTEEKYFKQVWDYMKHDTPMDPAGDKELDASRAVCMIIKKTLKDIEGGRRKGTIYGEGYANTFWMVDAAAGVCFTILTDVAPFGDAGVAEFHRKFEREVYRSL